jgi:ubiquinol oxidase
LQKFWVLEVVARLPYMSAISVLHLYESLGLWRAGAELRKVHYAEEVNELHHLQARREWIAILGCCSHWEE